MDELEEGETGMAAVEGKGVVFQRGQASRLGSIPGEFLGGISQLGNPPS